MRAAEVEANAALFMSRTLVPPARVTIPKVEAPVLIGFDSEFRPEDRSLLSIQFAAEVAGKVVSALYEPPAPNITALQVLEMVRTFLDEVGLEVPTVNGKRRVHIIAHFAAAELGVIDGAIRDFEILQVGKAHHGLFRADIKDERWELHLVDLFAFFKMALSKIGESVGLQKLDEDRTRLEDLKRDAPERFKAYAVRDAEIAVVAFSRFRSDLLERWGVDPLLTRTLPAVALRIFRHHFLTSGPAPSRRSSVIESRPSKDGSWRTSRRTAVIYGGDPDVRKVGLLSYWGGRVEAFVRGLVVGPVVERDVVSLYPNSAILQPLPITTTRWRPVQEVCEIDVLEGFGVVKFTFNEDFLYPCLPVQDEQDRLCFPRCGESACTFAEMRVAIALGAKLQVIKAVGFEAGDAERDHDVARFMRNFIADKAAAPKGTLANTTAKLLLNSLIGKFAERAKGTDILTFEREALAAGLAPGVGAVVARSGHLRAALRRRETLGGGWAPEWASLILGRARALMAEIVARGALLVSTDSVIIPADLSIDCPSLDALRAIGSDLPIETTGDAVFIARSRLYGVLKRLENITPKDKVFGQDEQWAVVRAARHGAVENEQQFAQTVLACLAAGADVAPIRKRTRLVSAEDAVRTQRNINDEVEVERRVLFNWDSKRKLLDRDNNPFTASSETRPYYTIGKLEAAQHQRLVRRGEARRRRHPVSRKKLELVFRLLRDGFGVREISRHTGLPKSTVSDLKARQKKAPETEKE